MASRPPSSHPSPPGLRDARSAEFPAGATHWPADLSRRDFLTVMGASLALAGLGGCSRAPQQIVSYVVPPEKNPAGDLAWYATAMPLEGFARGILVKSVQGRPIKIEGNPDHPESLGATDAVTQAAILSLYDPDRSATPRRGGQAASWSEFEPLWRTSRAGLAAKRGAGLAILTEPTTSPTILRELGALLAAWPEARWYQDTPLARYDRDGQQRDYDFAAPDLLLVLGGDPFLQHPAALRYVRAFATRRRVENARVNLNRLYAIEPTLSLTGSLADQRLAASPDRLAAVLNALAGEVPGATSTAARDLDAAERAFVADFSAQLSGKTALCVAGPEQPPEIHAWADTFNARHAGDAVRTRAAVRSDADARSRGGLAELVTTLERGEVEALWIFGANPLYTAPAETRFAAALRRVPLSVHVGGYADETAAACTWHLPEAHFLETWGDLRGYDGTATIQQPLIEPMHGGRSAPQLLRLLRTGESLSAYELVRETWQPKAANPADDFESRWHTWLNRGVVDASGSPTASSSASAAPVVPPASASSAFPSLAAVAPKAGAVTLLFRPDPWLADGRYANNAWLQELPRPFTTLVWENAALIDESLATALGLKNGHLIACETDGVTVEAPVWILPGQAKNCITLPLGGGRTGAGEVGNHRGFNAAPLRTAVAPWQRAGFQVRAAGRIQKLVTTQEHFTMDGRDLARALPLGQLASAPAEKAENVPALFSEWPRDRYAWGMSIDLGTCIGCSACVAACQAENNIPVVGRDQVARGREMHWIRVDQYVTGDATHTHVLHQPVPCMHCEHAPCELVCPVGATVHSSEGLNDMVYNRCVGTRYCSNNCPYKVRRFNFLDYRHAADSPLYLQANPDVTIRERGVMEKCTYCVQRITTGRIAAEKENRRIRDGEIRTACQQACPTEAIVFGDLNDPASRVAQRKRETISYALLAELNTRPRTTYLAKVFAGDAAAAATPAPA